MGVNCLTAGMTLKDADGLISLTQLTVNQTVHREWPGAAQMPVCKKQISELQLLFALSPLLHGAESHPGPGLMVTVAHMETSQSRGTT